MLKLRQDAIVYKGCYAITASKPGKPGKLVQRSRVVTQIVIVKVGGIHVRVPVKVRQQYIDTVGATRPTGGGKQVPVLVKLRLKKGTRVNCWELTGKCRAEFAYVVSIVDREGNRYKVATSPTSDRSFKYPVGTWVKPSAFNSTSANCGPGINFFRSMAEAWQWVGG